jgi:hypothetical protein
VSATVLAFGATVPVPGEAPAAVSHVPYMLPPVPPGDHGDQLVVLFGDSLSFLAAPQTEALFRDDPDLRLSASYYGGTELDTQAWVEGYPQVGPGSVVLVMLGINDLFSTTVPEAVADATAAIGALRAAGADRVVLVTVNSTGWTPGLGPEWLPKVTAYNDWLRQTAADDPIVEVADWDAASRGRRDWLEADQVHLNAAGQVAYAQLTHDAARG